MRGREKVVANLVEALRAPPSTGGAHIRVLHGLGGCGKTALALELCARSIEGPVWWVSAGSRMVLRAGLTTVARQAGAEERELVSEDLGDVLWRRLANLSPGWLLVIDNADDPDILAGPGRRLADGTGLVRPTSVQGMVVVTSRSGRWPSWCRPYRISVLDEQSAALALRDAAGVRPGALADARTLANWLGRLPLAVHLAGAYLAATTTALLPDPRQPKTYRSYLALLENGGVGPSDDREMTTEVTERVLTVSIALLNARAQERAVALLRLLATFAEAPVPFRLMLDVHVLGQSRHLADTHPGQVSELLQALADLALIDIAVGNVVQPTLSLHPLVRRAVLETANDADVRELRALAAETLNRVATGAVVGSPEEPGRWGLWQLLAPHVSEALQQVGAPTPSAAPLVAATARTAVLGARALYAHGAYQQAMAELERARDTQRVTLGDEHPDTLATRHQIARVRQAQGDYHQARREFHTVYELRRQVLGPEHVDTLITRHQLARALRHQGRPEARDEFEAVHAAQRRLLGEEHPDTLITRHNLASVLHAQGEHDRARNEFQAVHDIQQRVFGAEHPATLVTRHNLAGVLHTQRDLPQARAAFQSLYDTQRRVLGAEHPDTLVTRQNLAAVRRDQGELEAARAELSTVYDIQCRVCGPEHPQTLMTRHHLARTLHAKGEHDQARVEYQTVLRLRQQILGRQHRHTLTTWHELAGVLRDLGEQERAMATYADVYEQRRDLLGEHHPDTRESRYQIAGDDDSHREAR
ncbi:FxSxx-COOH system tetratricopeptide repeat protein [Micromonospora sp. NBRC 101691]|uniref:FxSxx-COOH system tetratricopeptide repeat protein n=1 Tax=Micromonospora sp. NBRC 101691 TaxID=3032198 RepID=UPI0025568EE6|nr:FxSxx-COOH system tetratricopeptide repeat protein [Micromonospora sp. NBRC 101691]